MKRIIVKTIIGLLIGLLVGTTIGMVTRKGVWYNPETKVTVTKKPRYLRKYEYTSRFNKSNFLFTWSIASSILIVVLLFPELKEDKTD